MTPLLPFSAPQERAALVFPDRTLSHGQLDVASAWLAAAVAPFSRVAVIAEARIETCVAVAGALRAGVPVIPLNPRSGTRELAHVVRDAAPAALLLAPGVEVPEPLAGIPVITIDLAAGAPGVTGADAATGFAAGHERVPTAGRDDPEAPALIVYTSGTTGPPKGAVLPRRAIASNLDALASAWAWTDADVVAHGLPLFHVHGLVIGILGPLRRGGTAVHIGRFSADAIGAALTHHGATMIFGVPTMYRRLADAAEVDPELAEALAGARLLISGSAPLARAEHERLLALTGRGVLERYGMTETLMNTALRADGEPAPGTVGPALDGVDVRLVDDHGVAIDSSDGETIGEIQVRGPNLFTGYLNRADATAEAMRGDWFATGDMATRDDRGFVRIVGRRATDLIKSGGYKIGAGELEAALREHPGVEDAAVTGEADADLGERVIAWVVLRDGAEATAEELADHVAAELAPHKRPRTVHFLAELPRNELGKVQKQRLK